MKLIKIILTFCFPTFLIFGCAKEYSVETGGRMLAAGNWEFKDSSNEYMGQIDTSYIVKAGNSKQLNLLGKSLDGSADWSLRLYADTFVVGTYKAALFQSSMKYSSSGKTIYQVNQVSGDFSVKITAINASLITGTFAGTALDSLNRIRNLFDGKFKSTFKVSVTDPVSVGVLGSNSGNCDQVLLNGDYTQGIAVTAANTATINVVVATPGTFNIYTNSVNGISFSKQGTFTKSGPQTVVLNATGTPAFPGDQTFTLHYGNSQCAFKVTFDAGVVLSNDYYPLNAGTNWTYSNQILSLKNQVLPASKTINGQEYAVVVTYTPPTASTYDTLILARKSAGNYYGFGDLGSIVNLDDPVYGETIFLKDNVPAGNTWNSDVMNGKLAGVAVTFYYKYTILSKGVPETVGGFPFDDIIKVKQEIYINSSLISTGETWYAKNVGPVTVDYSGSSFVVSGYQIK